MKLDGFIRDGLSVIKIINNVKGINEIDVYGFNCGFGLIYIYDIIKKINIDGDIVLVFFNVGYLEIIYERIVYFNNLIYFV